MLISFALIPQVKTRKKKYRQDLTSWGAKKLNFSYFIRLMMTL